MNISIGLSTCPNDTFIFEAIINNRINTKGIKFNFFMADVEQLNKMAFENKLDITKISFHAYAYISKNYKILDAGSALGKNNGPLLISKRKIYPDEVPFLNIAIPGKNTTANLLLKNAFPKIKQTKEYLFSDIEDVVLSDEADAGLIIHETRFTYEKKGLQKIIDLGQYWEKSTNLPVPLGGIIVNRKLSNKTQKTINQILKQSVEFALKNPQASTKFIKKYAQEIDNNIIKKHIDLYVNKYTLNLTKKGKKSIKTLLNKAVELKFVDNILDDIFVNNNDL